MLSLLHIENIAVIECSDIQFDRGFNVLTGETGAGKSIVIDAISAVIGERTYRDVIRTGSDKASVSAVFYEIPKLPWFEETGVDYDPDELMITRDICLDGRNACRVNGRPVSVAILRRLGESLIRILGQHDSQQFFDEETHLASLDQFAKNEGLRQDYREAFDAAEQIRREIAALTMDESTKLRRVETLRREIGEIEDAGLKDDEEKTLESRRKLLQNAERLMDSLEEACAALYGDDETDGAAALAEQAAGSLAYAARFTEELKELQERVNELSITARDTADELRDLRDSFLYSEDELNSVEARLAVIGRLRKKYGVTIADILSYLETAKAELDAIVLSDETLETLKSRLLQQEAEAMRRARLLRENRREASGRLQTRILEELAGLDMQSMRFECQFEELPALTAEGLDRVRFLMSANVGEALKPMSKVASGGELARIMLAMQNVLAENEAVPTLIFDEVDSGVSGRAAQRVAEKLRSVAGTKQVLCVTHLAQIAALASTHFLISKAQRAGRTYTSVAPLDRVGREGELARIIGGAVISDTTRKSAAEMLDAAERMP